MTQERLSDLIRTAKHWEGAFVRESANARARKCVF